MSWQACVITLLPEAFPGMLGHALAGRALDEGVWSLDIIALRDFGTGKHQSVDDTPSGGGAGMVLRADIAAAAYDAADCGTSRFAGYVNDPARQTFNPETGSGIGRWPGCHCLLLAF